MQVPGARDVAVEFFTQHVEELQHGGLAVGYMVGNKELVSALAHQELPRLWHFHADPGGVDHRARRRSGLSRKSARCTPDARDVTCQRPA